MKYRQGFALIVILQWFFGIGVASADEAQDNVIEHIGDALGAKDLCSSFEFDLPSAKKTAEDNGVDWTPGSPAFVRIGSIEIAVLRTYAGKADKAFCDKMFDWYGPQGMKFLKLKGQN